LISAQLGLSIGRELRMSERRIEMDFLESNPIRNERNSSACSLSKHLCFLASRQNSIAAI
jgi:hypothetical protein